MTDIRTILFDLDGTLADTAPDLAYALNTLLQEQGRATLAYERIRPEASHGAKALLRLGFGLAPGDAGYDALRTRFLEIYAANLTRETRLFDGMPQLLADIRARGMNWGIVTNKPKSLTDPLVEQLGIRRDAVCVVSGDTTANSKPHPEPMLHACRAAGSRPDQCLYVGDAARDIEAGRVAGMQTLVALFGYINTHDDPDSWGADGMIRHPREVLDWLASHD
jgi:phosphoglycolate phosphatase